ncbi:MAG: SPFH domain-containing protein [Ruminococcaceae bacterium]|nr:SPFH domain-containing protein [Oscillospiraceae bacterium]
MSKVFSIIKYEGNNDTFVWKSPVENFNTGSQLIVHESQEALFFLNGQALDLFGPGRHTLETQNIPLLRKALNKPTGDETPYTCSIYFINKVEQMAIKWGTDSMVSYIDPTYNIPLSIGASGEMSMRVEDSRKLIVKLVGTEKYLGQDGLTRKLRAFLMTSLKPLLSKTMSKGDVSIFNVDSQIDVLSNIMFDELKPPFLDYGLSLERFFITNVARPDGDRTFEKFKDLFYRQYGEVAEAKLRQEVGLIDETTAAQRKVIDAEAQAAKRRLEGYTYQDERGFDVAEKVAENEGVGTMASTGIGLGLAAGVGVGVGGKVAGITTDALGDATGGTQTSQQTTVDPLEAFRQQVAKLQIMKESGLISDDEFEKLKQELLAKII